MALSLSGDDRRPEDGQLLLVLLNFAREQRAGGRVHVCAGEMETIDERAACSVLEHVVEAAEHCEEVGGVDGWR